MYIDNKGEGGKMEYLHWLQPSFYVFVGKDVSFSKESRSCYENGNGFAARISTRCTR